MKNFNDKLAVVITDNVGTMYCAYLFAIIGIMGITGALTNNVKLVLVIGAVSGYFLQLVLLPIIMVAGNIHAKNIKKHVDIGHADIKEHITKVHKGEK